MAAEPLETLERQAYILEQMTRQVANLATRQGIKLPEGLDPQYALAKRRLLDEDV